MKTILCSSALLASLVFAANAGAGERCGFGGGFSGGFACNQGNYGNYGYSYSHTPVTWTTPVVNYHASSTYCQPSYPTSHASSTFVYHKPCAPAAPVANHGKHASSTFVYHKPCSPSTPVANHGKHGSSTFVYHKPCSPSTPVANHGKYSSSSTYCSTPNCPKTPVTVGKPGGKPGSSTSHGFVARSSAHSMPANRNH